MVNVMVDIETLSTRSDAGVLSIGLAAFDDQRVLDAAGIFIRPEDVFGHIDPVTIKWWLQQAQKTEAMEGQTPLRIAASCFQDFFRKHEPTEVWANSPAFDCVILRNWWERLKPLGAVPVGAPFPFSYRQERDYRTFQAIVKALGVDVNELTAWGGVLHDPVDDACNQARRVIALRKHMSMLNNMAGMTR